MMTIVKTLNNNIVLVRDDQGTEKVLFGTGIGFKKKRGDMVDETLNSKIFTPNEEDQHSHKIENYTPEVLRVSCSLIARGSSIYCASFCEWTD